MDFLNNKKNLPIVIAVAVVVIAGAVFGGLYFGGVIGQPAPSVASSPAGGPPGMPGSPGSAPNMPGGIPGAAPGMPGRMLPPGAPGGPGGPGMASGPGGPGMPHNPMVPGSMRTPAGIQRMVASGGPSAGEKRPVKAGFKPQHSGKVIAARPKSGLGTTPGAGGTQVASALVTKSTVSFVGDPRVGPDPFYTKQPPKIHLKPFNPIDPNDPRLNPVPPLPPIPNPLPNPILPPGPNSENVNGVTDQPVVNDTLRRVSGILHSSDGVFAVLETNGVSQTVQPGDDVGGAKVTAIDNDGVTLKTDDNQVLHVPLSDTAAVVNK